MAKATVTPDEVGAPPIEDFAAMLDESLKDTKGFERRVVTGNVISIENDVALIDVGLKAEGRVPLREFATPGDDAEIKVGDKVEVYVERMESSEGEAVLSREKARREESWNQLEQAFKETQRVTGTIFGRVKGGFTVDLSGAVAFLPGSQVDIRPVRDIGPLMNSPQPFQILKMDRQRGNIVVSRRAVLEETRAEARSELIANLKEGQVLQGVVKNITDYGAFIDLGGIDGLLHVTDIAWKRINHPSEALQIGQTVDVQVIRFNSETQRISLGMKQLEADPWEGVAAKYPTDTLLKGRVTNITDYGAFVELEAGIEGLIHVSEMSWTKKNIHPGKIVSTSQEVEIMVLDVDAQRRRISLGLKQTQENPWHGFADKCPAGTELEGDVKNITEFGLFVGLPGGIDGMVHLSDLDWERPGEVAIGDYNKGDAVKVKVLDIDIEKERVSLGVKQLSSDPFEKAETVKRGSIVTCTVTAITTGGIEVAIADGGKGFIRKTDLSSERSEQRPDRFAVGEKVDAKVTSVDKQGRKINLSIKGREIEEDKKAMAQYGSSDSGASLGDILGAALNKATVDKAGKDDGDEPPVESPEPQPEPEPEPEPDTEAAEAAPADADASKKETKKTKPKAAKKAAPKKAKDETAKDEKPKAAKKTAKAPAKKTTKKAAKKDDEDAAKAEAKDDDGA